MAKKSNLAKTANEGLTLKSSLDACVDLFALIGKRKALFAAEFEAAFAQNPEIALRILQWARDVRGGAGERATFRNFLKYLEEKHPHELTLLLPNIPEIGRWDDLLVFETHALKTKAFALIKEALDAGNGLCAKWMPRESIGTKGRAKGKRKNRLPIAKELRTFLGLSAKDYRKLLVRLTSVVETQMCANKWDQIDYNKVPALAAARYQKAFARHDTKGYDDYKEALSKPNSGAKINAGAVYPYDVLKSVQKGDQTVAIAQWDALPNYMEDKRIIPMVDTSGSMGSQVSPGLSAMMIAVSLGIYVSDKLKGAFNGVVLTFSASPTLVKLQGNVVDRFQALWQRGDWGMNTNVEAAFRKILDHAKKNNVLPEDMPEMLLIISDMEFDYSTQMPNKTTHEAMEASWKAEGYDMPQVVFWNVKSRSGNFPVRFDKSGAALVSGFSPAIMQAVLKASVSTFSPEKVMLEAVMQDRYAIKGLSDGTQP